jgi:hypothetical protein
MIHAQGRLAIRTGGAVCYSVPLQIFEIEKYVSIIPANAGYLDL